MISIRREELEDSPAIRAVNERAFGQPEEARIVDKLRESCDDMLSLVATRHGVVVGHILFSPVTVERDSGVVRGMGLAPMAVVPEHQREGIGSELVEAGLAMLRERGSPFVIVLGHPADEAFMILILDESAMAGVSGVARYRDEFDEAM
jgi:putative acetyltransferase